MLEFWYKAWHSVSGIIIRVSDPERAKQKLYASRKDSNDPDLSKISIVQSPTNPNNELWLVKKDASERG